MVRLFFLGLQGKTTSVHALARELLGTYYKDAVLELNASDARGIDVRFLLCSASLLGAVDVCLMYIFYIKMWNFLFQ